MCLCWAKLQPLVGILLMTQGERIGKLVIIGVISIVIGTILFLWGWKLLQMEK